MYNFNDNMIMSQRAAAEKVAAARGWTIEANGNIGEYSEKYGWSFFFINRKGQRGVMTFNRRSDWKTGMPFPYNTMDEAEYSFEARSNLGVPHFICETDDTATNCIIASAKEFGASRPRMNYRTGKTIWVRTLEGARERVIKVANVY